MAQKPKPKMKPAAKKTAAKRSQAASILRQAKRSKPTKPTRGHGDD
jgi:hypothetical protein